MRKITSKERSNGMRYCTFCKPSKVHAIWRTQWLSINSKTQFACPSHMYLLQDGIKPSPVDPNRPKTVDSGRMTEADYQSWNNKNVIF